MDYFIYYLEGEHPDIAIVEADSVETVIQQLKKFYRNVSPDLVKKIDCHRDGYADGIMIISEY